MGGAKTMYPEYQLELEKLTSSAGLQACVDSDETASLCFLSQRLRWAPRVRACRRSRSHTSRSTLAQTVGAGQFTPPTGRAGRGGESVREPAGLLPRRRDADAVERLRHQDRSLDARVRLGTASSQASATARGLATISYPAMATALAAGYATVSTDTGHVGGNANFMVGHPEKLIDFEERAVHEMTVTAKAIVAAFYGSAPERRRTSTAARPADVRR